MKSRVPSVFLILLSLFAPLAAQQEIYVQSLRSFEAFKSGVVKGALGTNGSLLVLASADKNLKVFQLQTGREQFAQVPLANLVSTVRLSRDGQQIVTARIDGQINYWNTANGMMSKSLTAHAKGLIGFGLGPDQLLVLAGSDNMVILYDPTAGEEITTLADRQEKLSAVEVSPDGKKIVVATDKNTLLAYDSTSQEQARVLSDLREQAVAITMAPDGRSFATGGIDGTVRLWKTEGWSMTGSQHAHSAAVTDLAFDPNGRWIATASADSTIRVYELGSMKVVKRIPLNNASASFLRFTNAETLMAADSKGMVHVWKVLERPPDTTAPAITILQPARYSADAPTRIYAPQYEIFGMVYDESDIKEVTVGDLKATLRDPKTQNASASGAGLKGKEFSAVIPLKTTGMNVLEVKVSDASNNTSIQPIHIQRLTNAQAVEIIAPAENVETENVAIEIQFKPWFELASYSIGANAMDIVDNRGPFNVKPGETIKEEVPLVVGYNQIVVNLVSKKGDKFTKMVGVNRKFSAAVTEAIRKSPSTSQTSGPQRWAVIVGVSEYGSKSVPALKYADRDAEAMAAFLQTPEGGLFDKDHMRILINKDATLSNLREAMIDFLQQAIDKDLVLIYFAGHGAPDPTRPQNLYLLTHDTDPSRLGTTAFPMWDIQTVITRQIQAKKVVVFSDACHSGGISVDVATRGLSVTENNPINSYLAELARAKEGMVVFTASAAGEVSQEFPELGHGVFTYYILEGVKGAADSNNDLLVTVNELMGYVEEQVKRKTRGAQNPTRSQTTYDKELPMSILNK